MKDFSSRPQLSIFTAFILVLPLLILNYIANNELQPFYTFFEVDVTRGFSANPVGYRSLFVSLMLIPAASFVLIRPLFKKEMKNTKFYFINIPIAAVLLLFFIIFSLAWISEANI